MQQSLPQTAAPDHPVEQLVGSVERVTFHSEQSGFCVLRVKVRGHRDIATVVGTAATSYKASPTTGTARSTRANWSRRLPTC